MTTVALRSAINRHIQTFLLTFSHSLQQHLFQNSKAKVAVKAAGKTKRFYKDVGLGFKTPAEAINVIAFGLVRCDIAEL